MRFRNEKQTQDTYNNNTSCPGRLKHSWFGLSRRSEDRVFCLVFGSSAGSNEWKNNNNNNNKNKKKFRILFVIYLAGRPLLGGCARLAIYRFCGIFALRRPHRWRWPMTILFAERKQMCISTVLSIDFFCCCPPRCRAMWTATLRLYCALKPFSLVYILDVCFDSCLSRIAMCGRQQRQRCSYQWFFSHILAGCFFFLFSYCYLTFICTGK